MMERSLVLARLLLLPLLPTLASASLATSGMEESGKMPAAPSFLKRSPSNGRAKTKRRTLRENSLSQKFRLIHIIFPPRQCSPFSTW